MLKRSSLFQDKNCWYEVCGVLTGVLLPRSPAHEVREDVDWYREDNGTVLLGGDVVQRLQVAQLKKTRPGL